MITLARSALLVCLGLFAAQAVQAQTCPPNNPPRVAPDSRYLVSEPVAGQLVVTDLATSLMWKQCPEGLSGATCVTGTPTLMTWSGALSAANSATHAGFGDWRLPNLAELRSLVETSCHAPSINVTLFPANGSVSYWSASTRSPGASGAWFVNFGNGSLSSGGKAGGARVRLVRGGNGFDTFSAEADRVPDTFSLAAQSDVALTSERTSNTITVAGLTTVTGIAVTGASGSTVSINGGPFTAQPGTLTNGAEVQVRHTSAASNGTPTTTTLSIGGVTADFVSTTLITAPGAPGIGTAIAGDASASVEFTASDSDGGSAITGYIATSDPGSIASVNCLASPCTVGGLTNGMSYTFTVTATNSAGTGDPSAASNSVMPRANQTISFGTPPTVVVDGTGMLLATGGDSGNSVVFTSSTTGTCSVSGTNGSTITGVSVGTCTIAANQAGSAAFNPATQVTQNLSIGRGTQATLTATATPPAIVFGGSSTLSISGGSGEGAVSSAVPPDDAVCSVTGNTLTAIGVGSCTVTATKAADDNYNASTAMVDITVSQATQTIAFGTAPSVVVGGTGTVSAIGGGSGNPVVYTSQTPAVCSVTDTTVTGETAGTCTIAANQEGNANYDAAAEVTQDFAVEAATATIVVSSNTNPANVGDSVTLIATMTGQAPTGTVEFLADGDAIAGCSAQTIHVPAMATCASDQLAAGTRAITANYSGDANNTAASSDPFAQLINAFPTLDALADVSLLEDGSTAITITLADAETPADILQLSATSSNPSLLSDAALTAGLGGNGASRALVITPLADAFGVATLTLTVTDGNGASTPRTLGVTVTPVNDPPLASYGSDRTHPAATVGVQTVAGFATGISAGPPNEAAQEVNFETVIVRNAEGIVSDVTVDAEGTLRYTLNSECVPERGAGGECDALINVGAAEIAVTAVDDGGTGNGGIDRGTTRRLLILVGESIIDLTVDIERIAPVNASLSEALANGETSAIYQITVGNNGPLNASPARVAITRQIGLLDVLWTCFAPAVCVPGNGDGLVDARFDLAVGQTLAIEVGGEVDVSQPFVELVVKVFAPTGVRAVFTDNDSASVIEPPGVIGVFKDGFER